MMTRTAIRRPWGALAAALCLTAGCGGTVFQSNPGGGDSGPTEAPDTGTEGPCGANEDCPSGSSCYFPIGSCDAKGVCVDNPPPGTPVCKAIEALCGCGKQVTTGCGFPQGYASGPTTGTSDCALGEGGPAPLPDSGAHLGPCATDGACPAGSSCYYPIGNCEAKGECIENPPPGAPECGAIELLCGCDGKQAYSGCGYPNGYGSAPSTGSSDCNVTDDAGAFADSGSFACGNEICNGSQICLYPPYGCLALLPRDGGECPEGSSQLDGGTLCVPPPPTPSCVTPTPDLGELDCSGSGAASNCDLVSPPIPARCSGVCRAICV
jgi:hypothetical protein